MNASEIQKRERIECVKIIQVSIPNGQLRGIEEHARKYDGQQNALNRLILRAVAATMQHDKDIEKDMEDAKNKFYNGG